MNLYLSGDQPISTEDFIKALSPFIFPGDTLLLELDLTSFGKIAEPQRGREAFLGGFDHIFNELLGPTGNWVVPGYSFSWGDDAAEKVFDIRQSPGRGGIYPEFIRKRLGVDPRTFRTPDPLFSNYVVGADAQALTDTQNNSFGKNSIYDFAHQKNAKLVAFGLRTFNPTFVHYVEQTFHESIRPIEYRFLKKFTGKFVDLSGGVRQGEHFSFMRNPNLNLIFNENKIRKDLLERGMLTEVLIGGGSVLIADSNDFFDLGIKGMKQDPHYFVGRWK